MSEICPVCGLPKDLCVCEAVKMEQQRIKVRVEERKRGRYVTIIEGLDYRNIDLEKLATILKVKCACGGTAKEGRIELQGDHRGRIKQMLVELNLPADNIDVG